MPSEPISSGSKLTSTRAFLLLISVMTPCEPRPVKVAARAAAQASIEPLLVPRRNAQRAGSVPIVLEQHVQL